MEKLTPFDEIFR